MAVPTIDSITNASYVSNTASLVITKPTGLEVGETMVAIIANNSDDGSVVGTITPPAGWTTVVSYNPGSLMRLGAYYKVADSGDVAASNFTFTNSDTSESATVGSILRLSDAPLVTGYVQGYDTDKDISVSFGVSESTDFADCLLIMALNAKKDSAGDCTLSTYTINGTNPTWTEQRDTKLNADSNHSFAVATANISDVRTITSFGATASATDFDHVGLLLFVHETLSQTASNVALEVVPALFTPTISNTNTVTNATLETLPNIPTQSADLLTPTTWTTIIKS